LTRACYARYVSGWQVGFHLREDNMKWLGIGLCAVGAIVLSVGCGGDEGGDSQAAPANASGSGGTAGEGTAGGAAGEGSGGSMASSGGSSGTAGASGGEGGGAAGQGGAGGEPAMEVFESNPPGAELDLVITEGETGLTLLNSNAKQTTVVSTLVEWFAEVRNDGQSIACYPRAYVTLYDAADGKVWETDDLGSFADTKPYHDPSSTLGTVPCLAPGEVGVFFSNELRDEPAALATVTRVHVELTSVAIEDVVAHPHPALFANVTMSEFSPGGGYWLVEGDLTAAEPMDLTSVNVYLRDPATGFYESWRYVSSLDVIADGDTWHFETNSNKTGPFADLTPFVSWYYP
jgi:hypothetical protein